MIVSSPRTSTGLSFRDALDRGQGLGDAGVRLLHPVADLRRALVPEALFEELDAGGEELPRLGDLGAAVDRGEGVAPARDRAVHRERELPAGIGGHDLRARLPRALGQLV